MNKLSQILDNLTNDKHAPKIRYWASVDGTTPLNKELISKLRKDGVAMNRSLDDSQPLPFKSVKLKKSSSSMQIAKKNINEEDLILTPNGSNMLSVSHSSGQQNLMNSKIKFKQMNSHSLLSNKLLSNTSLLLPNLRKLKNENEQVIKSNSLFRTQSVLIHN